MKVRELLQHWNGARAPELTAERYAIRLTVEEAARVHALAELYSSVSVEDILRDLISAALVEVEEAMPYVPGPTVVSVDDHGDPVFEDAGPTPRFIALARKHRERLSG